jgi:uncharacterized protein
MLIVTSVFASILTIIYIKLAWNVIALRGKNKVSLGSGGVSNLEKTIRAHGNFSEYSPIALILMGCLEINGAPWWFVTFWGLMFTIGRLLHAKGIHEDPPHFVNRIRGMKLTFNTLIGLIVSNLGWILLKLFF